MDGDFWIAFVALVISGCALTHTFFTERRASQNDLRSKISLLRQESYELIKRCTEFKRILHRYNKIGLADPIKTITDIDKVGARARKIRDETENLSEDLKSTNMAVLTTLLDEIREARIDVEFHVSREEFRRALEESYIEDLIGHGPDALVDPSNPPDELKGSPD